MRTLATALMLIAALLMAAPAAAVEDVTPARVEGGDRVETAAEIARLAHPEGIDRAVVATSEAFQDALAGAGLAGSSVAAQLLVRPDEVPAATAQALDDLGVTQIQLLGDTDRISAEVEAELSADRDVTRISADTPPQLAAAVAEEIVSQTGIPSIGDGTNGAAPAPSRTVFVANGERFADALAGSSPAYLAGVPVLFSTTASLYPSTAEFLSAHANEIDRAVLLGGTEAISEDAAESIGDLGVTTERVAGPSRVETSLAVADWAFQNLEYPQTGLLIARGDDFPDSLTAGQYGGPNRQPIILSATPEIIPETALNWIRTRCPVIEVVRAVGGEAAISTRLLEEVEIAAESCADDGTPPEEGTRQTYEVAPMQAQEADAPATFDLGVIGRYDQQEFTGPVDLVLFPCEGNDVLGSGDDTFADVDDDDHADGFGTTDTGAAAITRVNQESVQPTTVVVGVRPELDGALGFQVSADAPDCTVAVVVAGDGDGELDLDDQDRPVEDYGVGFTRWS